LALVLTHSAPVFVLPHADPYSKMHRALTITEILQHIFQDIDKDHDVRGVHPISLAALARTCTTFRDPALDILWEFQYTVMHLLECFPRGLIFEAEVATDDNDNETEESRGPQKLFKDLCISRPITEEDWGRPLLYFNRVKNLDLHDDSDSEVLSTSAFHKICTTIPGGGAHLFPKLITLHIYHMVVININLTTPALCTSLSLLAPGRLTFISTLAHQGFRVL